MMLVYNQHSRFFLHSWAEFRSIRH